MIDPAAVCSVKEFKKKAMEHTATLKDSRTPLVLTVDGSAELVVQGAVGYQEMVDRIAELELVAEVKNELASRSSSGTQPAEKALAELGLKHGLRG